MSWSEWLPFVVLPICLVIGLALTVKDEKAEPDCPTCGDRHNWRVVPKAVYDWEAEQEGSDA